MFKFFLTLCAAFSISLNAAEPAKPSKINWQTNYEEAVNQAKSSGKPLLLFFTGSDWCGWCHKLENEALNTVEFGDLVGDKFIFVLVDFPLKTPLDPATAKQNKELQRKFDVRGYPTIVLLDEDQRQLGTTGYRPGGAKSFADHLLRMVGDTRAYKQKVSQVEKNQLSSAELEALYGKALELCRFDDADKLLKLGMKTDENRFFLLERYRKLAEEGFIHQPEALHLKEQLLAKDPDNAKLTQYEIAVIEFAAYSEEMDKEGYAPELTIAPLVSYVDKFGNKDSANLWRINMIISQVYLDHSNFSEALKYAKLASEKAPPSIQSEIDAVIKNIEIRM